MTQNIWFTADTHFGHSRIIEYCKRPFKNHEEQNEVMIQCFNEVIKPGDLLYHLGDVAWSSFDQKKNFLDRLNTKEVFLILGNHDKASQIKTLPYRWIRSFERLHINKISVAICHYPLRSWEGKGRGAYNLYGHCHGTLPGEGRQLDVGVDTHDFYPYNWDEICAKLSKIGYNVYD